MKRLRQILSKSIFTAHFLLVIGWYGLFIVPLSLWADKVYYHFYFSALIASHQVLWGIIIRPWTKRFRTTCFLTSLNQLVRGYRLSDRRNYEHSFMSEFMKNIGISFSSNKVVTVTIIGLVVITLQYFY